jgi:uncharacterized protein
MLLEPYGEFSFGNVLREHFADALETAKFRQVLVDIQIGIKRCAETCPTTAIAERALQLTRVL